MVGAKEFAINRKVIQKKKTNPLAERIHLPAFIKEQEKELNKMPMDNLQPKRIGLPKLPEKDKRVENNHIVPKIAKPFDAKTTNPILAESKKNISHSRLPFLNMPKPKQKEEKEEREEEDISDELANRITYKVLKNIQSYFGGEKPMGNKHIKLEISL